MMSTPNLIKFAILSSSIASGTLIAQTTWTGANSTNMTSSGNWDNGGIGRGVATIFDNPALVPNQPNVPDNASNDRAEVNSITFNMAGWDITNDGDDSHVAIWSGGTPFLTSNGAGTNRIAKLRTVTDTPVTTGAGNTLVIDGSSGDLGFSSKSGTGTLIINNSTLGRLPGSVEGGFIFNGTMYNHGGGTDSFISGSLLGGNAVFEENNSHTVEFASGATLAPGMAGIGDTTAGTMEFRSDRLLGSGARNYNINMLSGSTLAIDLFADGSSDTLVMTGDADANTAVGLAIDSGVNLALSGTIAYSTTYTLVTADLAGTYSGTFDTITLNGVPLTEGDDYNITYTPHANQDPGIGGIDIEFVPVPEPQTYAFVAGLAGLVLALRRRR